MIIQSDPTATRKIKSGFEDSGFTVSVIPRDRVVSSGGSTTSTVQDSVIQEDAPASFYTEADVVVGNAPHLPILSSSAEEIATIDQNGVVTWVANGTVDIEVSVDRIKKVVPVTVSSHVGATTSSFKEFVAGSLGKSASDAVDAMLVGKSAASALKIFTSQDHSTPSYIRNASLWCASLVEKLTCCSPWNSTGGNTRAGTLVTPRHIIYAAHYQISDGATVRFVTSDGTVVNRTQTKHKVHPSYSPHFPDLVIGVLDSDLPETITPCEVPPSDFEDYLPGIANGVPCICLDQEKKALVTDSYSDTQYQGFKVPSDPKRLEFYEPKIVGDSGNPAFMVINGELVLLTVWTYGGAGSGTDIGDQITTLNQMIADADTLAGISTGYTLTEVDLSGFTSYP